MPGMNGEEALGAIRALGDKDKSSVPVIAVTANAIRGMRDEYLRKGFDDYLSKPVETPKIEQILKDHLPSNLFVAVEEDEKESQETLDIEIESIDVDAGLAKCGGSARDYLDVLDIFAEYGPGKADEIEKFAAKKDYENYTSAVHALKSVAANIGAHQLFTMARIHEMAGKSGNKGFIDLNFPKLVTMYRSILDDINASLEELGKKEQ